MSRRTTARILKIFSFTAAVAIFAAGTSVRHTFPVCVPASFWSLQDVFCSSWSSARTVSIGAWSLIFPTISARLWTPLWRTGEPDNFQPYEDSAVSKAQGKLLQYYDKMRDEHRQSALERQTLQELVNDISHQVKTPVANIQMFTGILREQ